MLWNTNGKLFKDDGTSTTHNYMGFTPVGIGGTWVVKMLLASVVMR